MCDVGRDGHPIRKHPGSRGNRPDGLQDDIEGGSLQDVSCHTPEIANNRYDILGEEEIDVAGAERPVLRVNVATGLINETV